VEGVIMNFVKSIGTWLLAVYLILQGLVVFVPAMQIPVMAFAILGIAAGVMLVLGK
jgi:hypothetical protein